MTGITSMPIKDAVKSVEKNNGSWKTGILLLVNPNMNGLICIDQRRKGYYIG
jgi:hypothetical protein